jgi:glycosyltransferase involved in cell wall biosynthesis
LKSISLSTVKPHQIVIVASGEDIASQLEIFNSTLPITYLHTEISGQIHQKKLGISLLNPGAEWCLFLDDDLELHSNAIEIAFREVSSSELHQVVGIGFSLPVTSRVISSSRTVLFLAALIGLNTKRLGRVLKSGHATSYLQSENTIQTEWLNGASMWRTELLVHYGSDLPSTRYAACEDLIFSFPLNKYGKLIYIPDSKLSFQDDEFTNFDSYEVIKAATYWRYYFVKTNPRLSVGAFLVSQVGRVFYATVKKKNKRTEFVFKVIKIHVHLLQNILRRRSPLELLVET